MHTCVIMALSFLLYVIKIDGYLFFAEDDESERTSDGSDDEMSNQDKDLEEDMFGRYLDLFCTVTSKTDGVDCKQYRSNLMRGVLWRNG